MFWALERVRHDSEKNIGQAEDISQTSKGVAIPYSDRAIPAQMCTFMGVECTSVRMCTYIIFLSVSCSLPKTGCGTREETQITPCNIRYR